MAAAAAAAAAAVARSTNLVYFCSREQMRESEVACGHGRVRVGIRPLLAELQISAVWSKDLLSRGAEGARRGRGGGEGRSEIRLMRRDC